MELWTRRQITDACGFLTDGNFWYWVRYKARLDPVQTRIEGRRVVDLFPADAAEKILAARKGAKHDD